MSLPPLVVLFGRPGAGKGTLADLLVRRHGYAACSTGSAMRAWAAGPAPEQQALRAALARGEYGSDELAARIVHDFLAGLPGDTPGVVLDGFPRTPAQLEAFLATLAPGRLPPIQAIELETPEATCRERIARRGTCPLDGAVRAGLGPCGRCGGPTERRADDDNLAALGRRFADYVELVEPTLALWRRLALPVQVVRNDEHGHALATWARWIALHLAEA